METKREKNRGQTNIDFPILPSTKFYVRRTYVHLRIELLAVVNNAGILATGEVEFGTSLEPFEKQLEVNCLGTVRVTKAFSPLLRRCKTSPRLVNVTSLAARISLPGRSSLWAATVYLLSLLLLIVVVKFKHRKSICDCFLCQRQRLFA